MSMYGKTAFRFFTMFLLCAGALVSAGAEDSRKTGASNAETGLGEFFTRIDENYVNERYEENEKLLKKAEKEVSSHREEAEYLWRLSRNILSRTDNLRRRGEDSDTLLENYKKGERYADEAVSLDSENHHAYYWRASNIGRWGQTKGIINSLMKAGPMREDLIKAVNIEPDHSDSYFVLGVLYASVPKLVSFGNDEYAVSYSRKAIDVYDGEETKYRQYLKLAEHLEKRSWGEGKRKRSRSGLEKKYRRADSAYEKNKYYTGVFDPTESRIYSPNGVQKLSDKEEAKKIAAWIIDELEGASRLSPGEQETLEEAEKLSRALN